MDCHYTSASAGTGKTYTLTHKLAEIINDTDFKRKPRAIVTTFSKASATELKTRTRAVLYESQQFRQAEMLDTFLIGTVDSVAESFLRRYWNTLGLSPEATIISEINLGSYIANLIRVGEKDIQIFSEMSIYQPSIKWREAVFDIVEKASLYGLTLEDLRMDRELALREVERIYSSCCITNEALKLSSKQMCSAVNAYYIKKPKSGYSYKTRMELAARLRSDTISMQWLKDYGAMAAEVRKTASLKELVDNIYDYQESVFFGRHMVEYEERIWDIALDLFISFSERKRTDMKLTYTDLETYFLALLDNEDVRDDVRLSYTHLFVDEFQDSSALQVKIFLKLAEIIGEENCYFYGDTKQVVYSWRAADPDLTEAVISRMHRELPLSISYRTVESIVNFTNDFFASIFPHDGRIEADRKKPGVMEILKVSQDKVGNKVIVSTQQYVSEKILCLLNEGILPSQIAVLARTRGELKSLSHCLSEMGIPYSLQIGDGHVNRWTKEKVSRESQLVFAMLGLFMSPGSNLGKAMAICSSRGESINHLVSSYLDNGELRFQMPLDKGQTAHSDLSVSETVRLLISRAGLFGSCKDFKDSGARRNMFMEIIRAAEEYETECQQCHIPASIDGFRDIIMSSSLAYTGDPAGVCLSTIHKAKGLEWRYVIVMEANVDDFDDDAIFRKNLLGTVNSFQMTKPSAADPYPKVHITYLPPVNKNMPLYIQNAGKQEGSLTYQWLEYQKLRCKTEAQRTLYVAITRARDGLILVDSDEMRVYRAAMQAAGDYREDLFKGFRIVEKPAHEVLDRKNDAKPMNKRDPVQSTERDNNQDDITYPVRDVTPSGIARNESTGTLRCGGMVFCGGEGARLVHTGKVDDNVFGDCIHHLFAIPSVWEKDDNRLQEIGASYGVTFTDPAQVRRTWKRLVDFLSDEGRFGKMEKLMHELPFKYMDCNGRVITGDIDLVWKTSNGCVIVDYKTFQGRSSDIVMHAEKENYASQLSCYRNALVTSGERVLGIYLYFPVIQALLEIEEK